MQEIIQNIELCYIIDKEWEKFYKECTLESLEKARKDNRDIRIWDSIFYSKEWEMIKKTWEIVLTSFNISKYWKADTADIFVYLSLPKYPKKIQDKFKLSLSNMRKEQRNHLSYGVIKYTLDRWIEEDKYYS